MTSKIDMLFWAHMLGVTYPYFTEVKENEKFLAIQYLDLLVPFHNMIC